MQVLQLVFDAWVDVLCSRAQQVYACSLHVQLYICISTCVRLCVHTHPSLSLTHGHSLSMSPPSSHPLNVCVRVQDVAVAEECYTQQLRSYQQLTAQVLCFPFAFRDCW